MSDLVHIMFDLETLGTVPGCSILSIGAVRFHPEENRLSDEFYKVVSRLSCADHFLEENDDTIEWWETKSPEARQVLYDAENHDIAVTLPAALMLLNDWMLGMGGMRSIRLYGNGADFDNPILRVAQDAAKVLPFNSKAGHFGGRCYRTLKSLDELFGPAFAAPKLERQGTYHNALDDAKHQARHLMETVRRIRAMTKVPGDI